LIVGCRGLQRSEHTSATAPGGVGEAVQVVRAVGVTSCYNIQLRGTVAMMLLSALLQQTPNAILGALPLLIIVAIFYLLVFRPMKRRKRQEHQMPVITTDCFFCSQDRQEGKSVTVRLNLTHSLGWGAQYQNVHIEVPRCRRCTMLHWFCLIAPLLAISPFLGSTAEPKPLPVRNDTDDIRVALIAWGAIICAVILPRFIYRLCRIKSARAATMSDSVKSLRQQRWSLGVGPFDYVTPLFYYLKWW